ncbi:MAG: DUF502 domain-containing protein [Ancalomicrobiaceae bacterium]|nr:DUF502 domain-containing protein [Ancalomicrobiaceae bacterium]
MSEEPLEPVPHLSAMAQLRNNFLTGVVVAGPIAITAYLANSFLEWVDGNVKPLIPSAWNPDSYLPFAVPGFGLLVAVILLTMLGALTANLVGRTLITYGELLVERTPFVRSVYKTLKQVFETFVANKDNSFSEVGLIEWPRKGVWSMVFVSGAARGEVAERLAATGGAEAAAEFVTVFIPTTPNPTGGYIMFLPRKDVIVLDMTIEEAARLIISAGVVVPEQKAKASLPVPPEPMPPPPMPPPVVPPEPEPEPPRQEPPPRPPLPEPVE